MKKILTITLGRLRNAEHFQLMSELMKLILASNTIVEALYTVFVIFKELFAKEDECLVLMQKSNYTELMADADQRRDSIFRGLVNALNAALRHFDAEVIEAAKRLKIVFDTYGNLAVKPNNEETAGIYNLVQDLEGKYSSDVDRAGLTAWVAELKANNEAYDALARERYDESAERPETKLKQIRLEMDEAYRNVIQSIEVLAMITRDESKNKMYNDFIAKFNPVVQDYKNRIAQRDGIRDAKKEDKDENND